MSRRLLERVKGRWRKPSEPWAIRPGDPRLAALREAAERLSDLRARIPGVKQRSDFLELSAGLHATAVELGALARELQWNAYPAQRPESAADGDPLLALHRRVERWLERQRQEYPGYAYVKGGLYQGLDMLQLFGLRSTEQRYRSYGLDELLGPDDRVLDVGANCGFLAIYASFRTRCRALCIEHNPYLVGIGEDVARYLEVDDRVEFVAERFQDWEPEPGAFTVVFSMASHHTKDEGLRLGLEEHMRRMRELLSPGGTLVFESHGSEAGDAEFHRALEPARAYFDWDGSRMLDDGGRELFLMKRA